MKNQGFIIAKEGFKFIFLGVFLTLLSLFLNIPFLAIGFGVITLFVVSFFRNPPRIPPSEKDILVSPADGVICKITEAQEKKFLKESRTRVSIFMSPFNCHINRSPLKSKVIDTYYHPGKFHVAHVDKASDLNEQHALLLEDDQKNRFVVVQIAGWLARRIVSHVKPGDTLNRGDRFGLIQFGSRVDVYLPSGIHVLVKEGQKVKAGLSIIGKFYAS